MPLQTSGPISLADVNVELARPSTTSINMNDDTVRGLAGKLPAVILGLPHTYGMADFYGKSRNVPINWQVYGGGAGGGTNLSGYGSTSSGGAGGGAAGVRVRSAGGAIEFTPGQWYTVVIGAGGAGAPLYTYANGGSPGTYSAIDSAGTWYYTTSDTTVNGLVSEGGRNSGYYVDEFGTTYYNTGYGARGGTSYFWGGISQYPGLEPYPSGQLGGGGGSASSNNGSIGTTDFTHGGGFGGNGAGQLTTSSIQGVTNFGGGGGGGAGGGYPAVDGITFGGGGGHGMGGAGGTMYWDSNASWYIAAPATNGAPSTGSGGGGGCGYGQVAGYGVYDAYTGANGSGGLVFLQYPDTFPALSYTGSYNDESYRASGFRTYRLTSSGQFKVG